MVDIVTKKHGFGFPSKVLSGFPGGGHIYNLTLAANHDNGELVKRGGWRSFDNYDEATGAIEFAGVIREAASEAGCYYVEVTAPTEALFLYNSLISPYAERDLRREDIMFNAAGDVVKAYTLNVGDIISVSEALFKGKIVAGKAVSFADGKYVVAA